MPRVAVVLLVSATLLALPVAASATLVYGVQPSRGSASIWVAADDGSGATKLATGYGAPTISPDGTTVAALRQTSSGGSALYVFPATGGAGRKLLTNAGFATVAWSPDSSTIAAYSGHRLRIVNLATGAAATLATGVFGGAAPSFSPAGDQIAYASATSSRLNARSNIYTVPTAGGAPTRLTSDGLSLNPVWGPTQIAYSRGPHRRLGFPRLNIWLMNPDGSNQRQLTNVRVGTLVSGLSPAAVVGQRPAAARGLRRPGHRSGLRRRPRHRSGARPRRPPVRRHEPGRDLARRHHGAGPDGRPGGTERGPERRLDRVRRRRADDPRPAREHARLEHVVADA
jgi:hypothetical protein